MMQKNAEREVYSSSASLRACIIALELLSCLFSAAYILSMTNSCHCYSGAVSPDSSVCTRGVVLLW